MKHSLIALLLFCSTYSCSMDSKNDEQNAVEASLAIESFNSALEYAQNQMNNSTTLQELAQAYLELFED